MLPARPKKKLQTQAIYDVLCGQGSCKQHRALLRWYTATPEWLALQTTADTCTSITSPNMKFTQVIHDCILCFCTEKPASHNLSYAIIQQSCTNITNIHVEVTTIWFPVLPTLWTGHIEKFSVMVTNITLTLKEPH